MSKKFLFVSVGIIGVIAIVYVFISTGLIKFETIGMDAETPVNIISVENLEDGCYYVWHNDKESNIENDLKGTVGQDVFRVCPSGDKNWNKNSTVNHTIWFTSKNDNEIPTLYPGDKLLYVSATTVPSDGIEWERFADYGYTIGVANLAADSSGHYSIYNSGDNGYVGYIYQNSDVAELEQYVNVSNLYLDKIGSVRVREDNVSDGGTVVGLKKNEKYICEWYTGTYYQDYESKANVHAFCSMETFTTYDYEFLHSRCIEISIPDWFKTGYYYINGVGMFRYVSSYDADVYNGKAYDSNIEWNNPIILYDENGFIKYDPTSNMATSSNKSDSSTTNNTNSGVNSESISEQPQEEMDVDMSDEGDAGAEEYEYIYNEIVIP